MESLSWIWQVGAGMIVGVSLSFGAWSAAASRTDRRAAPEDIWRDAKNVTSRTQRTAHTA